MKNVQDWITQKLKDIFWQPNYTFTYGKGKPSVIQWFQVRFDDVAITLEVTPPEREAWEARIEWARIIRVCFQTGDYLYTRDELYIFTDERPESYRIPIEAVGGDALWNEIIRRDSFPAALAIEAASTTDRLFCHPPPPDAPDEAV